MDAAVEWGQTRLEEVMATIEGEMTGGRSRPARLPSIGSRGSTVRRLVSARLSVPPVPVAGMFVWARLPAGRNAAEVSRRVFAMGVVLAPGNASA